MLIKGNPTSAFIISWLATLPAILATQFSAFAAQPISFVSLVPPPNATAVHPNISAVIALQHGDYGVDRFSIQLLIDGAPSGFVITDGTSLDSQLVGTIISTEFDRLLESGSTHTLRLGFRDDGPEPATYNREWSFRVLDYSRAFSVPTNFALATPPRLPVRGFALQLVSPDNLPITTIEQAEAIWDQPYHNTVAPGTFNNRGYYIEPVSVNCQIDGNSVGSKPDDRRFPGIAGSASPQAQFALRLFTLLYLEPGYHRLNFTAPPRFKLWIGPEDSERELFFTYGPCQNCSGDETAAFTELLITQGGFYPFRLLYFTPGGNASLEWFSTAPSGKTPLINENSYDPFALYGPVPAYVPSFAIPDPELSIEITAGELRIHWGGRGMLQTAPDVTGTWSDLFRPSNPHIIRPTESRRFYRVNL